MVGVEALARLEHPEYGVLSPSCFLSQVAKLGLMSEFYRSMLAKATTAMSLLNGTIQLSMNINKTLLDGPLYEHTVEICRVTNFPFEALTLELTEEQAYHLTPVALRNLARLSLLGVSFAIDDFGTGYASLEQLIDLPISELK
ncbi:EAL domain-containing protein [Vibrio alfacsensis]|uniref:EAL domain-containing protein n=1 Tax=Vibrio alfacsensis TaxID=1074311 RepID=A0ABN5PEJ7_9VIBR|nr:EAL domain-containing protein [Vibrio alfacsensis]AXY00474.1 EAL domain-containing protein [Vibrio alfacsensis]